MNIQTSYWSGVFTAALVLVNAAQSVRAEGPQTWASFGVNRVVRSVDNHREVSGRLGISFSQPINSHGLLDDEVNPYNNKPTAYLGGDARTDTSGTQRYRNPLAAGWLTVPVSGTAGVDGGVQFETNVYNAAPLGWTAFLNYNRSQVNPQVWRVGSDGIFRSLSWRGGTYGENGVEFESRFSTGLTPMRFRIGNAANDQAGLGLMLEMMEMAPPAPAAPANATARNRFFFHQGYDPAVPITNFDAAAVTATAAHPVAPWQPYTLNNTNQAAANVKRVSGMTRNTNPPYHSELDGSEVSVAWQDCRIDGATWTAALTNQAATGYDAPGNNAPNDRHMDRRVNGVRTTLSRTTVAFPNLDNTPARAPATNPPYAPECYANETVNVNLRMAAQPAGNAVEWAAP